VNNPKVHGILGDIHRMLATYGKSDFLHASHYPGMPRSIRIALRALSHEADSSLTETGQRKSSSARKQRGLPRTERQRILELLRRSVHFETTRALTIFARDVGIKINVNPKDGREKLASRIAGSIEKLPDNTRNRILDGLASPRDTQTQGWIDVIKSTAQ